MLTAAAHSTLALNAVRPHARTMGGDLRPLTGQLLTGPLTLAAGAVAGVIGRVGQVSGILPAPMPNRARSNQFGRVGFDVNSVPGLGGDGFGGPPVDVSNVPTTPRLNAALAMLQAANANLANARKVADKANNTVATETDPSKMGEDVAAQIQAITDVANAQGVLDAAAAEAKAAQAEAIAIAAAKAKPGPGPMPAPSPGPAPTPPPPAPVASKSSTLWKWLLGATVVGAGGYYIAEQL